MARGRISVLAGGAALRNQLHRKPFTEPVTQFRPPRTRCPDHDRSDPAAPHGQVRLDHAREPQAPAFDADDGPRLRSRAVRGRAQAADLPHQHVRVPQRCRRQASLRSDHRHPSVDRRRWRRRPRLFALQRAQPGNPGGPACRVGRRRGCAGVLVGHVGDRNSVAGVLFGRRRNPALGPALRRDRGLHCENTVALWRGLRRFCRGRRTGRDRKRARARASAGQGARRQSGDDLPRKPRQPDQCVGRYRGGGRRTRRAVRGCGDSAADRDRQHLPRAPVATPFAARRGRGRLFVDKVRWRPFGSRCGRPVGRKTLDGPGADAAQHDGHDLRSQYRVDAAAQLGNSGTAHDPRGRKCRKGLRVPEGPPESRRPWLPRHDR